MVLQVQHDQHEGGDAPLVGVAGRQGEGEPDPGREVDVVGVEVVAEARLAAGRGGHWAETLPRHGADFLERA